MHSKATKITKLKCFYIMLILLIVNITYSYYVMNGGVSLKLVYNKIPFSIMVLSWLGIITLLCCLYTWKKFKNEYVGAYTVFLLILFLFCYGQSICWIFGIEDFYKNLLLRESIEFIIKSQIYTLLFINLFHIGALLFSKSNYIIQKENQFEEIDNKALYIVGIIILLISLPAFLINLFSTIKLVINYGYGGLYHNRPNYSRLINILMYASKYFEPAIICILVSKYNNKKLRKILLFIFAINIAINLYIGGRSGAAVPILCIICIWHYLVKPINFKRTIIYLIVGYLFIGVLSTTAMIRGQAHREISDFIAAFFSSGLDSVSNLIGELGWSMTSIGYTMNFVPSIEAFRLGSTYLYGLFTVIPNLGFWEIHPSTVNAQLGNWLQDMLNINYGPGYTMVAESYINFSWWGVCVALIIGGIIGYVLSRVNREIAKHKLSSTAFIMVLLSVGLKPLVRSCSVVAFREIIYVCGGIYILYIFVRNSYRKKYLNKMEKQGV